ncbi:MAG: hypothetical protein ABI947_14455 [Chloroflexota bacterium]
MALPHVDTADLKSRVDCRAIARAYLGEPKHSAGKYDTYLAPRGEKTASFQVYADGFKDFGDGEQHGDHIELIKLLDSGAHDFKSALSILASFAGGSAHPTPRIVQRPAPAVNEPPSAAWQTCARTLIASGVKLLWSPSGSAALAWLRGRGLSDDTIRAAQLGYDGKLNRIVIPCIIDGEVWYVKYRNLNQAAIDQYSKYTYQTGSRAAALYNAEAIRPGLPIVKVEGEFDALIGQQTAGDLFTFVTVGSASASTGATFLPLFTSQQVISVPDNDEKKYPADIPKRHIGTPAPGMGHVISTDKTLRGVASTHKVVLLPTGVKDMTDYLIGGATAGDLAMLIANAMPFECFYQPIAAQPVLPLRAISSNQKSTLPDDTRAALIAHTNIGPVIEVMYEAIAAGLLDPLAGITRRDVSALSDKLGRGINASMIDRAFNAKIPHGADFASKRPLYSIQREASSYSGQNEAKSISCGKPTHRPSEIYKIPTLAELHDFIKMSAWLALITKYIPHLEDDATIAPIRYILPDDPALSTELDSRYGKLIDEQPELKAKMDRALLDYKRLERSLANTHSTPLPVGWTYGNTSDYRACLAHALISSAGGETQIESRVLSQKIGVSPRRVKSVLARAGIESVKQYEEKVIRSAADLPRNLTHWHKVYLENHSKVNTEDRTGIERLIAQGRQITLQTQIASKQIVRATEQPRPAPRLTIAKQPVKPPVQMKQAAPVVAPSMARFDGLAWHERGLVLLLEKVTAWHWKDDQLIDDSTGEIIPYSAAIVLALLRGQSPEVETDSDPLIIGLIDLGGRVTGIEASHE